MSLTQGSGPLGGSPADANYTIRSPAHKLLFEPEPRRLRAFVGDMLVLDRVGAHLLHETGISPVAYIPLTDIDGDLLERMRDDVALPVQGRRLVLVAARRRPAAPRRDLGLRRSCRAPKR